MNPTGKYPIRWSDLSGVAQVSSSTAERTTNVVTEQIMQDIVTDCMRPRMTEGASRESCGDGRVVEET
jgi:hypothetical protein